MPEPIRLYPYQPFEQISDRHSTYTPEHTRYRLDISRAWQDNKGIHGRVKIYMQADDGAWHCKHFEDGHLSTKAFYNKFLESAKEIDLSAPWIRWLQDFLLRITEAMDVVEPAMRAIDIPLAELPPSYCADLLLADVPNLYWAQGGTGKSWLSAWLSVCIASGTPWLGIPVRKGVVMYYDWEAGGATWRRRVELVRRGLGLDRLPYDLHYRHCSRSLPAMEETFAEDVHSLRINVLFGDAMGGAEGERKEYADVRDGVMGIFQMLRNYPITSGLIDHVAGEALKAPREVQKPYGSVYKLNQTRNAWLLAREPSTEPRIVQYHLQHKKINEGVLNQTGYAYELDGTHLGEIRFHALDAASMGPSKSWVAEMDGHLATRLLTVDEIAQLTKQKTGTVDQYLRRMATDTQFYHSPAKRGKSRLWGIRRLEDDESDNLESQP